MTPLMGPGLKPCDSKQCDRRVSMSSRYCCTLCADAWEAIPRYKPDIHMTGCNERHARRGPID
jgi:hypothetical protein